MLTILDHAEFAARADLASAVHRDRAAQFVRRHRWPLDLTGEGAEIDGFDAPGTEYLVAERAGRHLASLRLRRAAAGSMAEAAFPAIWRRHGTALSGMSEVTRLCSAPGLGGAACREAIAELLIGLCRHGRRSGQERLFGIVYPGVARAIARDGWQAERLDSFETGGRETWLCRWDCTAEADWRLQECAARLAERAASARQDRRAA
ncbi:acyl-homoserine-lactone synthase [Mangrovicoccus sp. HB161399]|uniref:acyl-homoserine-lactone synthase n=1 Tax=Mangrovicoccus sp. HB161399 TaxID=2720392 RepID=UPI001556C7FD|nr:acyl-homoserine-lactone synthase [Mangrovicoccus sp. HB161399]